MYLTYRPEGQEEQRWQLQLGKLRSMECEAIERVTAMDYGADFKQRLLMGNTKARRALLWTMLRRQHPTIKFADVDFADDELLLEQDRDELAQTRTEVEASDELSLVEKAALLNKIDEELRTAPEAPGKAPSPNGATGMPSPSPDSSPVSDPAT